MRHPRILEGPDHVQDTIDRPQLSQQRPLGIATLPRSAEGGKVQHLEGDESDLLGAEEVYEAVQARLEDLRHPDPRGPAPCRPGGLACPPGGEAALSRLR